MPRKKKNLFVIIMLIYLYDYYVVQYNINFFHLQISVKNNILWCVKLVIHMYIIQMI